MTSDLSGRTVASYRILSKIGEGGMATVWKAYQPSLDRTVALKVLPEHLANRPGFADRFRREAKAVAKLEHPHILAVFDYGQDEDFAFLAMPYIGGGTLKDLLLKGPVPLARASEIVNQIADALDHAHGRGVIHRDVKPSNILLDASGRALLTDFGVAKILGGDSELTGSGVGIGTPDYMSPEQGLGQRADARSDVYSLGVVLFEMLTGQVPFSAETPMAVVLKHIHEPLPLPSRLNPALAGLVEQVILRAVAKSPSDRFQSAGEMSRALEKAVEAARLAQPEGITATTRKKPDGRDLRRLARSGTRWALLATLVGVAVMSAVLLFRTDYLIRLSSGGIEILAAATEAGQAIGPKAGLVASPTHGGAGATGTEGPSPEGTRPVQSTPSVYFSEDFENGQPHLFLNNGKPWPVLRDSSGNHHWDANNVDGSSNLVAVFGSPEWSDYSLSFRFAVWRDGRSGWPPVTVYLRSQSTGGPGYVVSFVPEIYNVLAGYAQSGAQWPDTENLTFQLDLSRWYTVQANVCGGNLQVFIDGVQYFDRTDSRLSAGRVVLDVGKGSHVGFDDVVVRPCEARPNPPATALAPPPPTFLGGNTCGFSDEFESASWDPRWEWVDPRGDSGFSWSEDPGQLTLFTSVGGHDLYVNHDAPRMVQPVKGNFSLVTNVTIDPKFNYQGAGLLLWKDADNYVQVHRTLVRGIDMEWAVAGARSAVEIPFRDPSVYLKLERGDPLVRGYYSTDGLTWIELAATNFGGGGDLKGGMVLINEWQDNPISASFDFFRIENCAPSQP